MSTKAEKTEAEVKAEALLADHKVRMNNVLTVCADVKTALLESWNADDVITANAIRGTIEAMTKAVIRLRKNVHDDGLDIFRSTNGADKLVGVEKIEKRGKKADESDPFALLD